MDRKTEVHCAAGRLRYTVDRKTEIHCEQKDRDTLWTERLRYTVDRKTEVHCAAGRLTEYIVGGKT